MAVKNRKNIPIFLSIFCACMLLVFLGLFLVSRQTPSESSIKTEPIQETTELDSKNVETSSTNSTIQEAEEALNYDCSLGNFTTEWGSLMLINPNFTVTTDWIAQRKTELIDITETYGIREGNIYNGTPLLDPEAAEHLNQMLAAYYQDYPGHEVTTRSCFRSVGTNCGRLCYATGTTGLYETWHYRYVGIKAATEIATGKYNSGEYDSLEHYLKASGRLSNLLAPAENCH